MNKDSKSDTAAKRAALELWPFVAYLDDHDAGRVPANAGLYRLASEKVKTLLAPHIANPHIHRLCHRSQSLHQILGNILVEQEPDMAQDLARALDDVKITARWLQ